MKKSNINHVVKKNAKISDFFSKTSKSDVTDQKPDGKRKFNTSPSNSVLNNVINIPKNYLTPESKRMKQDGASSSQPVSENGDGCKIHADTHTPKKGPLSASPKKTPKSNRKSTPKKLFEKSPKKIEEFNVQVLADFVKLSPSTSNKIITVSSRAETPSNKKEISSPLEGSHVSAQKRNENTPSKSGSSVPMEVSPHVKTKLRFSEILQSDKNETSREKNEDSVVDELETVFDDMFSEDELVLLEQANDLSLDEPQFCKITGIVRSESSITLNLKSCKNDEIGRCTLQEFWCSNDYFAIGDKICVKAVQSPDGQWVVNNHDGWLVYAPDLLVPCTSIVRE